MKLTEGYAAESSTSNVLHTNSYTFCFPQGSPVVMYVYARLCGEGVMLHPWPWIHCQLAKGRIDVRHNHLIKMLQGETK